MVGDIKFVKLLRAGSTVLTWFVLAKSRTEHNT